MKSPFFNGEFMKVSEIKQSILLCRDAGITSFLWGHRGLGKSSLHAQIARNNCWGFINMRCSQMEASDLRGLPDKEEGPNGVMTVYRHPADLPHGHGEEDICPACWRDKNPDDLKPDALKDAEIPKELFNRREGEYCKGLLFLDELNRAEDDVLQAGFELVLDYKVGLYRVPVGWSVHCAGNYMDGYMVNNFSDPAFLDRFCHLNLTNSEEYFKGWSEYMSQYGGSSKIMQFVGFNPDSLIGKVKGEMGFSVQPSPRSWEFVAQIEEVCREKQYSSSVKRAVISGIIGSALALGYEQFTCELTPQDIMQHGMGAGNKDKLGKIHRNGRVGLIWGLAAAVKNVKKTKGMMNNVIDFMEYLAKEPSADARDLAVSLGRALCSTESEELAGAMLSNPNLARLASRWKQRHGNKDELSWINLINEREELQELMSKVSYGLSV